MGLFPRCFLLGVTALLSGFLGPSACSCLGSLPSNPADLPSPAASADYLCSLLEVAGREDQEEEGADESLSFLINAFLSLTHPTLVTAGTTLEKKKQEEIRVGSKSGKEET